MEYVDILKPPTFEKSGIVKSRIQAWDDGDWIGTFNLWIIKTTPIPSIIYQMRSPNSGWSPGLLDVSAGGHYQAGELIRDGLREVLEELGREYAFGDLMPLGRKITVSPDLKSRMRNNVIDIFMIQDERPIDTYELQKKEVFGICECPVESLLHVHTDEGFSFTTTLVKNDGTRATITVTRDSFPYNWDNYHYKMALLAERFLRGERPLIY